MSVYISICLHILLSMYIYLMYLSIRIHPSIHPPIYSISVCLYIYPSIHSPISLSIYLSIYLSICVSMTIHVEMIFYQSYIHPNRPWQTKPVEHGRNSKHLSTPPPPMSFFSLSMNRGRGGLVVALDCRSTGWAIDPASGAWFIPKFISLATVVPSPMYSYNKNSGRQHNFFHF